MSSELTNTESDKFPMSWGAQHANQCRQESAKVLNALKDKRSVFVAARIALPPPSIYVHSQCQVRPEHPRTKVHASPCSSLSRCFGTESVHNTMLSSAGNASTGLDRAEYNAYDEAERHLVKPIQEQHLDLKTDSSDTDDSQDDTSTRSKSFARVRRVSEKVRSKAKAKTNRVLYPSSKQYTSHEPLPAPALAPPPATNADNDRLYNPLPEHKRPQAKDILHHPVDTVSSALHGASGAKMADVMDNQTIAHGADVNLVRAHDKVAAAEGQEEKRSAMHDLEELKKARQDTYVRWTMDRHVLKVRRIPPLKLPEPHKQDYTTRGEGKGSVNWAASGQDVRLPFSLQDATLLLVTQY